MTSVIEKFDTYEIALPDLVVAACRRDSGMLQLELHAPHVSWTVTIEGAFSVRRENDDDQALPTPQISDLVGESVRLIRARKADGELEIKLGHDRIVTVEPDNDYEAWQMYSSNGERLIATPGGGIAVWKGER